MGMCDVCSQPLNPSSGYALTTEQVAANEHYWEFMLKSQSFDEGLLNLYAQQQAGQRTGWLICETCSSMFIFDRQKARDYAAKMQDPPGSGPADLNKVAGAAARAWKNIKGKFPSWVR
jgi:hypothetical protein